MAITFFCSLNLFICLLLRIATVDAVTNSIFYSTLGLHTSAFIKLVIAKNMLRHQHVEFIFQLYGSWILLNTLVG